MIEYIATAYIIYFCSFCFTLCYTIYEERRVERERILNEYRILPYHMPRIEIRTRQIRTKHISTLETIEEVF
jgi:hypothetical protein